jgi:hypothetical protein
LRSALPALDPAGASQFSGILEDLDGCLHKARLDTSALPWLLRFPSGDSCGDPVDVPALMLELSPDVESSGGKVAGFFFNEPVCWLSSGSGTFYRQPDIRGRLDFDDDRKSLTYQLRPLQMTGGYAAFVVDPDGYRLEAYYGK